MNKCYSVTSQIQNRPAISSADWMEVLCPSDMVIRPISFTLTHIPLHDAYKDTVGTEIDFLVFDQTISPGSGGTLITSNIVALGHSEPSGATISEDNATVATGTSWQVEAWSMNNEGGYRNRWPLNFPEGIYVPPTGGIVARIVAESGLGQSFTWTFRWEELGGV